MGTKIPADSAFVSNPRNGTPSSRAQDLKIDAVIQIEALQDTLAALRAHVIAIEIQRPRSSATSLQASA